jgi:hypothetical protein
MSNTPTYSFKTLNTKTPNDCNYCNKVHGMNNITLGRSLVSNYDVGTMWKESVMACTQVLPKNDWNG